MKTIYKKLLLLVLLLPFSVLAQSTLSGNVKDQVSGLGLPGVNVTIQGGSGGTTTDFDGNFSLSGVKSGDVISFDYLGFKNSTVAYTGQSNISVTLQEDASQLEEVVVIGYGTTTKKDATGALTNITSEQFNKGPLVSADQLLQGRVAGWKDKLCFVQDFGFSDSDTCHTGDVCGLNSGNRIFKNNRIFWISS